MKIKTVHTGGFVTNVVDDALVKYGLELAETIYLLDNLLNKSEVWVYATHKQEQDIAKLIRHSTNAVYYILDYIRGDSFLKKELETAFKVIEKYQAKHDRLP